jgi:hypothetical protein
MELHKFLVTRFIIPFNVEKFPFGGRTAAFFALPAT